MRIIVMGQQAFGKDVLSKIVDSGADTVVAVFCEPDKESKPFDPIKELALSLDIPVYQPNNFQDEEVLSIMKRLNSDLMLMAFVNLFVPESFCAIPKLGSICFHPSLLPLHRGPSAVNWPIIMGSKKSGFSWFYPTDGLDEGDILLSKECTIEANDTVIDLYFKKIYPEAVDSASEVCELFRSGNPPRIKQHEEFATYERRCTKKHSKIDWHKPVQQVYNLIRGTNPAPGAWAYLNGKVVSIFDCELVPGDGVSGRIIKISSDGVTVQCIGGRILIKKVRLDGVEKKLAGVWAEEIDLKEKTDWE